MPIRNHIWLREVLDDDLDTLFEIEHDPESNAMAVANARTREEFDEHWQRVRTDTHVRVRASVFESRLVGSISCFTMDDRDCVGYWIAREFWGRGIATEAVRLLLDEVRARPLWARVAVSNTGSVRVLEKSGFVQHARFMSEETPRFPACEEFLMRLDAN